MLSLETKGEITMLKQFKVIIESEENGFSAHVPALPGCASQGDSVEETLGNIKEAIELYVWSLKDDNLPIPESTVDVLLKEVEVAV